MMWRGALRRTRFFTLFAAAGHAACAGARPSHPTVQQPTCTLRQMTVPGRVTMVLDGQVLGVEVEGEAPSPARRRIDALPIDSIFDLRFVTDSTGPGPNGQCRGAITAVFVTKAEARRLGLRPPPPSLCLRTMTGRALPRVAFPVGGELRFAAGQRDILGECDRAAPPDVGWTTSDPAIAAVDSSGRVRALSPGTAEVVAHAGGVEVRFAMTIVPPVARIEIRPGDTTITVGDTVRFRAVAIGVDGRPIPDAVVALRASETRASYMSSDSVPRRTSGVGEVHFFGPGAPRPVINELPVLGRRAAIGYVVAVVVGRADSVRIQTVNR